MRFSRFQKFKKEQFPWKQLAEIRFTYVLRKGSCKAVTELVFYQVDNIAGLTKFQNTLCLIKYKKRRGRYIMTLLLWSNFIHF